LKKAIAHGDLSENAEYHSAKLARRSARRLEQMKKRLSELATVT